MNYCYFAPGVSSNVSVDKEQILSKRKNENGWWVRLLSVWICVLEKMFTFQLKIFNKIITGKINWDKTLFMVISIEWVILMYQFLSDGHLF